MRITNLPASSNFSANDVLAIEISGVTYKLTGATLAEAIKSIGDYVTTSDVATTTADGLMTSSDKVKLNGIASGAQVNTITGVKGNAESDYRTGNVNLTPTHIGALSLSGGTMKGSINFSDSSSHNVGGVSYVHDTNGTDRTYLIARTLDGSSNIQLGVKRNGDNSLSYHFTNPTQFRQDAGITPANIGALSVAQAKTVSTYAITAGAKWTVNSSICYKIGALCVLHVIATATQSYGNTSSDKIGTVASGGVPTINISSISTTLKRSNSTYNYAGYVTINADGDIWQNISSSGQIGDVIDALFVYPAAAL